MRLAQRKISFTMGIGEDENKRLAFTETLRKMYRTDLRSKRIVMRAHTNSGTKNSLPSVIKTIWKLQYDTYAVRWTLKQGKAM